ncbi:hypothetical protein BDZ89DRAFT_1054482 [Hymenopellis radicata]|nr:hypothetical protein BDZ89DRAFT_1054482 [Hymenopellis radicata]
MSIRVVYEGFRRTAEFLGTASARWRNPLRKMMRPIPQDDKGCCPSSINTFCKRVSRIPARCMPEEGEMWLDRSALSARWMMVGPIPASPRRQAKPPPEIIDICACRKVAGPAASIDQHIPHEGGAHSGEVRAQDGGAHAARWRGLLPRPIGTFRMRVEGKEKNNKFLALVSDVVASEKERMIKVVLQFHQGVLVKHLHEEEKEKNDKFLALVSDVVASECAMKGGMVEKKEKNNKFLALVSDVGRASVKYVNFLLEEKEKNNKFWRWSRM